MNDGTSRGRQILGCLRNGSAYVRADDQDRAREHVPRRIRRGSPARGLPVLGVVASTFGKPVSRASLSPNKPVRGVAGARASFAGGSTQPVPTASRWLREDSLPNGGPVHCRRAARERPSRVNPLDGIRKHRRTRRAHRRRRGLAVPGQCLSKPLRRPAREQPPGASMIAARAWSLLPQ